MSKEYISSFRAYQVAYIVVLAFFSLLVFSSGHSLDREAELQKIFQLRKEDEWKSLWHTEKHGRCRDQLLTHMDWACQKDIYRLEKKTQPDPYGLFVRKPEANTLLKPLAGFVIRRKRENKSITDECCNTAGCTWEEYAEYCPAHRRARVARSSGRK